MTNTTETQRPTKAKASATRTPDLEAAAAPKAAAGPRPLTKLAKLIAALQKPDGADIATMIAATGWQAHSIRGAMAGALRKRGHDIASEKVGDTRVWRIKSAAEAAAPAPGPSPVDASVEAAG